VRLALHLGWQPYKEPPVGQANCGSAIRPGAGAARLAGIVQSRRQAASGACRRQNHCRNPAPGRGLQMEIVTARAERRARARLAAGAAFACLLAGLLAFAWPGAAASAPVRVVVLGQTATTPAPSCPGKIVKSVPVTPCRVEGHVTGFQAAAGGVKQPYEAPFDGTVVAWSITLARPSHKETASTANEVGFFNGLLGKPSEARIGILRPIENSKPPRFTLVRQSPLQVLNRYFGSKVIFALDHPLTVLRGQVVALTVPTWAPMFAFNVSGENTWRGSRAPKHCSSRADIQGGHPQQGVGKTKTYGCFYSSARLLYTATLVKQP
jgi:hypothetical protein